MTKDSDPKDESLSALPCGCDPRENHKCERHSESKRCILGHWNRMDNCPACQVIKQQEDEE